MQSALAQGLLEFRTKALTKSTTAREPKASLGAARARQQRVWHWARVWAGERPLPHLKGQLERGDLVQEHAHGPHVRGLAVPSDAQARVRSQASFGCWHACRACRARHARMKSLGLPGECGAVRHLQSHATAHRGGGLTADTQHYSHYIGVLGSTSVRCVVVDFRAEVIRRADLSLGQRLGRAHDLQRSPTL